jgi:hypothetical protein
MDVEEQVSRLHERRSPSPAPRSRVRVIATALLLGGLALAWLSFAHSSARTAVPVLTKESVPAVPPDPRVDTARLRMLFADAGRCVDASAARPRISCAIDGVRVEASLFTVQDARAVYEKRLGVRIRPGTGAAACAQGAVDERSWSRAAEPAIAVGRYRCRLEGGRAALWWTDEHGVLAHAVAADPDLRKLFRWWLVHRDA